MATRWPKRALPCYSPPSSNRAEVLTSFISISLHRLIQSVWDISFSFLVFFRATWRELLSARCDTSLAHATDSWVTFSRTQRAKDTGAAGLSEVSACEMSFSCLANPDITSPTFSFPLASFLKMLTTGKLGTASWVIKIQNHTTLCELSGCFPFYLIGFS